MSAGTFMVYLIGLSGMMGATVGLLIVNIRAARRYDEMMDAKEAAMEAAQAEAEETARWEHIKAIAELQ